jgi:hypothetical protein
MHTNPWWKLLFHIALFCLIADRVVSAPALSTVQDTLYKADGTRFTGSAYVEWKSFVASDNSVIAASTIVVPVIDGNLRVRLVPTSNASQGAHYFVRFHADGRVLFTETWNVPPSAMSLRLPQVRVASGASTGGGVTPPAGLTIPDITGLSEELANRPVRGFTFANNRALLAGPTGALEAVSGNLSDCVRVDGTSGACGSATAEVPSFIDAEIPSGDVNGSNAVFTLSAAPSPAESLQLYRNGLLLRAGADYNLAAATITFVTASIPQSGDLLAASFRTGGPGSLSAGAGGALTGPFTNLQLAAAVVSNYNVASAAGITESKLALNYPTHSNANDPSANEKAALSGTAGAPSASNKFVTHADSRLSDARPPQTHPLLSAAHNDTVASAPVRGDLIAAAGSPVSWRRLYTGFNNCAIPFTDSNGALAQNSLRLFWDNTNRRLSVGNNLNAATLSLLDSGPAAATSLLVRAGAAQSSVPLQVWQSTGGADLARLESDGALTARRLEVISTSSLAGLRENPAPADPSSRADGDQWMNAALKARKSVEAGQVHTLPQVVCSAAGAATTNTAPAVLGSCAIPAGMLQNGDRIAIAATWRHSGSNSGFTVRAKWANALAGSFLLSNTLGLVTANANAAIANGTATFDHSLRAAGGFADLYLGELTEPLANGLTLSFEGFLAAPGDSLSLVQFTVLRYPAQANP